MNEKLSRRIIIGLAIVCVGLVVWLGLIYRNHNNTKEHLATASTELSTSVGRNDSLNKELLVSTSRITELEDKQSESSGYQQELEAELARREDYISRLEAAEREGSEAVERSKSILGSNSVLFEQGNEFAENREE